MGQRVNVTQFNLVQNTVSPVVVLAVLGLSVPLLAIGFLKSSEAYGPIMGGIGGTCLVLSIILWCLRMNSTGSVLISEEGITVKSLGRNGTYRWDRVSAIEVVDQWAIWANQDRLMARIRMLKLRVQTDILGSPSMARTVLLRVDDPEAFISAAQQFADRRIQ